MRALLPRHLLASILAVALTLMATSGFAHKPVAIHIDVIVANHQNGGITGSLDGYESHLAAQFPQFSQFTVVHSESLQLPKDTPVHVALPGNFNAYFTLQEQSDRDMTIEIQVPGGTTTLKGKKGGRMFVGGPHAPDGTILLFIRIE